MSSHISDSGATGEQLSATCRVLDGSAGECALRRHLWEWAGMKGWREGSRARHAACWMAAQVGAQGAPGCGAAHRRWLREWATSRVSAWQPILLAAL